MVKKKDSRWIQKATASIKKRKTAGKCTPITKPGCTGRAKALALTFKKIARNRKKEDGGFLMDEFNNLPEYGNGDYLPQRIPSLGLDTSMDTTSLADTTGVQAKNELLSKNAGAGLSAVPWASIGNTAADLASPFFTPDEINSKDYEVDINEGAAAGKGALKGAGTGAAIGSVIPGIGTAVGAGVGALVGGVGSFFGAKKKENVMSEEMEEKFTTDVANKNRGNRLTSLQPQPSYMPVAAKGGFISYKGQSHDGDRGGIPVDQQGNPTFITNSEPVALTEDGEVTWFSPDEGAYVFSDKLGFAKPAQKLVDKYKLDEKNIDDPYMQTAVDKQFENLKVSQENKRMQSKKRKTVPIKQDGGDLIKLQYGTDEEGIPGIRNINSNYIPQYTDSLQGTNAPTGQISSYMPSLMGYDPQNLTAANYTDLNPSLSRFGKQYLETPSGAEGRRSYSDWQDEVSYNKGAGYTAVDYDTGQRMNLADNIDQSGRSPLLRGATDAMPGRIHESIAPARIEGARGGQVKDIYSMAIDSSGKLNPLYDNAEPSTALHKMQNPADYTVAMSNTPGEEGNYNPMLSPLGHGLSAIGSIADYYAMKKAKPEELSLPRVGAERVSYARQRLANRQRANEARALGTRTARNMGLSGATAAANIGATGLNVNQQLGQQNILSYENEANKNAMLRQQAGMTNAQIAMQEGLYNNRLQNAYRAQMAQMNPFGQLARTGAGYFKDNAAYQRGWDTLQMLSPNAEISQEPGTNWLDKVLGETRSVNFRGEPLKYTTK